MHMNKTRVVHDALPIKMGQEIVLPSGRLGIVIEIGRLFVTFLYADAPKHLTARQMEGWTVDVPRRIVANLL